MPHPMRTVLDLYRDGFRNMTVGRSLWKIIIVKVVILFGVLKFFFFPDFLRTTFHTDQQRAAHVLAELTRDAAPLHPPTQGGRQ